MQPQKEYKPGTIVFAKLKVYPYWPARIESDHAVPAAQVLKQRSKTKATLYTVLFYGSKDYGFLSPDAIRPFIAANVENDLKASKFKTEDLEFEVRQALNLPLTVEKTTKKRKLVQRRRPTCETKEYKDLYLKRHRLQKLVYNKREGEIPKDDYVKILQVVNEIKVIPMTYELLKETKIAKVVKAACTYPFVNDYEIRDQCQQLMKGWKSVIPNTQS